MDANRTMDAFGIWLTRKEQLEDQKEREESRIKRNCTMITDLQNSLSRDPGVAASVYIAEIELLRAELADMEASLMAIDNTLKAIEMKRSEEVEAYDDADRWERFLLYNGTIQEKLACIDRDRRIIVQLGKEIDRLQIDPSVRDVLDNRQT